MTTLELKEKLETLKAECDKRLNEKGVFTELVCNYVDNNQLLNDDYTSDTVAICYDLHFFIDDGEESAPVTLSVKLDANGEPDEECNTLYEEFLAEVTSMCESIETASDPRQYIKEQTEAILNANITDVEKVNRNANTMLFAALAVAIILIAWIIYSISRG